MIATRIAEAITNRRAAPAARRLAHDWMLELLSRPFSAAETAEKLGISKPTAIKWLRAGLIRRAEGTSESENLFDAASVLSTREILQKLKMTGTVAERARVVAELPERLYWNVNVGALEELKKSLREAESGQLVAVTDAEIERGQSVLAKRRVRLRRRAARRRPRSVSARAS